MPIPLIPKPIPARHYFEAREELSWFGAAANAKASRRLVDLVFTRLDTLCKQYGVKFIPPAQETITECGVTHDRFAAGTKNLANDDSRPFGTYANSEYGLYNIDRQPLS